MNTTRKESVQVKRTRALIAKAFSDLMQEKNFDEISIVDICERAIITRATFYKYYEDKYHLVTCVIQDAKETIIDKGLAGFKYKTSKQLYLKVVELVLTFINHNQKAFEKFFKIGCNEKLKALILQMLIATIQNLLEEEKTRFKYDLPLPLVSSFIAGGFSQAFLYVFENNLKYDQKQVLGWLDQIFDEFYIKQK